MRALWTRLLPVWPDTPDNFVACVKPLAEVNRAHALYFAFEGDAMLAREQDSPPSALSHDDVRWLEHGESIYLGELDGRPCFAVEAKRAGVPGFAGLSLRSLLGQVEPQVFYLAGRAYQLLEWERNHRFCGVCGTETRLHDDDRARVCPKCQHAAYPRLSPSMIVLVWRGDEVLLARNAAWPNGFFSTLAGFVEPGESLEQTVHREVKEEVGVKVANLEYKGSQSWPFPNSLMLGFHAEYESGEIVCQDEEIAEAHWYKWDSLPSIPPKWAISRWLIDEFVARVRSAGR